MRRVAIPSGRGIRSGPKNVDQSFVEHRVAIPSGRGIRSGTFVRETKGQREVSQSPLVGAFVPAFRTGTLCKLTTQSQSPLVGAFVPALTLKSVVISEYFAAGCEHVGKNGVRVGRPGRPTDHGRK